LLTFYVAKVGGIILTLTQEKLTTSENIRKMAKTLCESPGQASSTALLFAGAV